MGHFLDESVFRLDSASHGMQDGLGALAWETGTKSYGEGTWGWMGWWQGTWRESETQARKKQPAPSRG